jgi:hypothetical protein
MRPIGLKVALAACALALAAPATDAVANEFVIAAEAPTRSSSGTAGEQQFHLGSFTIACAATSGRGSSPEQETLVDSVRFRHCQSTADLGGEPLHSKAVVAHPVDFAYTASGHVGIGRFAIQVQAPRCTILVGRPEPIGGGGAGAGKAAIVGLAAFTNVSDASRNLRLFPTGFQHKLSIQSDANSIEVAYEGACKDFAPSTEGTYSGIVTDEAVRGDLEGNGEGNGWNRVVNHG